LGSTYRFLAVGNEADTAIAWLQAQPGSPEAIETPGGLLLYFRDFGPIVPLENRSGVDLQRSPLVSVIRPALRRGALWSIGEVHFLPSPLRRAFPQLHAIQLRFARWLSGFDRVFTHTPSWTGEWNYWLEGSIRNDDGEIFALPQAMEALRCGQYFVGASDGEGVLDSLSRTLRHRGVECGQTPDPTL